MDINRLCYRLAAFSVTYSTVLIFFALYGCYKPLHPDTRVEPSVMPAKIDRPHPGTALLCIKYSSKYIEADSQIGDQSITDKIFIILSESYVAFKGASLQTIKPFFSEVLIGCENEFATSSQASFIVIMSYDEPITKYNKKGSYNAIKLSCTIKNRMGETLFDERVLGEVTKPWGTIERPHYGPEQAMCLSDALHKLKVELEEFILSGKLNAS